MVREGRVLIGTGSDADFGSGYLVTAYEVGAQVSSASSSTTINVRAGHGFAAADKLIVGASSVSTARYRIVTSVTSTTIVVTEAVSVASGEYLVNLGPDTGTTGPNYDGSGATVYTDMGYVNTAASSTVASDAEGRYRYFHRGIPRWELVRTSTGTPYALYLDAGDEEIADTTDLVPSFKTGGDGAEATPWTGWETGSLAAIAAGRPIRFIAGWYSSAGFSVPVTLTNTPSKCVITGDGSACTFLTITGTTGQFRVYGSGSGTRVLDGVRVTGLTIFAGANNTSAGLVSFENFDIGSYADDIRVDPTASYTVAVGIQVLNCENCHFGMLEVRGRVVTLATAGHVETGLKIYTDDGIQRGDMHFKEVHVTDITTGLSISSSGGSLNNLFFGVFKAVNPSVVNGTLGVSITSNGEQITFGNIMLEALANGLAATGIENLVIVNGLASQIHNVANNAGAAYTITDGSGGSIFSRIDTVYNGIVLAGTTTRTFVQATAAGSITGTYFTDSSSGSNLYIVGNVVTSAMTVSGRFTSNGGFSIGARAAAGLIATGVVTLPALTTNNWTVDTEAAAATDDLDTITGGADGDIIVLSAVNDARTVVVKNGTGNIHCGMDRSLDHSRDTILLQKVGSLWVMLGVGDNTDWSTQVRGGAVAVNVTGNDAIVTANQFMINLTNVSGTNTITLAAPSSIDGTVLALRLVALTAGTLTLADSGNVALSAAWVPDAGDTLTLVASGVVWYEIARSAN